MFDVCLSIFVFCILNNSGREKSAVFCFVFISGGAGRSLFAVFCFAFLSREARASLFAVVYSVFLSCGAGTSLFAVFLNQEGHGQVGLLCSALLCGIIRWRGEKRLVHCVLGLIFVCVCVCVCSLSDGNGQVYSIFSVCFFAFQCVSFSVCIYNKNYTFPVAFVGWKV